MEIRTLRLFECGTWFMDRLVVDTHSITIIYTYQAIIALVLSLNVSLILLSATMGEILRL